MDVISNNRNQEYLKTYNKNIDVSNYSAQVTDNNEAITKDFKVHQASKEEKLDSNQKKEKNQYVKEDLDKAIKKLNKFLEDEKTHAEYEKHKDLGTIMIKIIDDETEKIVVELPPEKVLNMIASLCEQVGILDKKA